MAIEELQQIVHVVEPAAQFVEPRILRRVIRLDRRLQGYWFLTAQRKSYTIDRDRLLAFVDREELGVAPGVELPSRLVLLSGPDDVFLEESASPQSQLKEYFRLLFFGCVHLELEKAGHRQDSADAWAAARRAEIGEVEFAEIRAVLMKDGYLFHAPSDLETYQEFAAVYLELRYFAPQDLESFFPAIQDWTEVDRIVGQDIDHRRLFERLQLIEGAPASLEAARDSGEFKSVGKPRRVLTPLTQVQFRLQQAKASRAAATGNSVKATLINWRAIARAPQGYEGEARGAALAELSEFVQRLKIVLHLSVSEAEQWTAALQPLLEPAADGFWTNEARLLYDLQKVCVEQERGVYRLDLIAWLRSRGKRPLRRPLPLMRDALMLRHFVTAARRVSAAKIPFADRQQLASLLKGVLARVETNSRQNLQQIIDQVFDEIGLKGYNVPEQVARRKLTEELLDRIVERGYLNMGDLRDAISKNDLKLPDVTALSKLIQGDHLLSADKKFETELDGLYRRGAVYQRWPQMLSSLVFGTSIGRTLTQFLFIPFGGAYLLVEFIRHVSALVGGHSHEIGEHTGAMSDGTSAAVHAQKLAATASLPDWAFYAIVLSLGAWFLLLIHRPQFRAWNVTLFQEIWRLARMALVEWPSKVFRSEAVQSILRSRTFAVISNYLLWPGILTGGMGLISSALGSPWSNQLSLNVYLIVALLLNSPLGRQIVEMTTDLLMRAWHNLKIHVFAAIYQWIVDVFQGLLTALERIVYTVDEWLRFRAGDSGLMQGVKLAGGVVWFFVSYIIVFGFTLLVEPQINPVKHFPVVTVSHKLILPMGPAVVRELTPYLGVAAANTIVWTTILLIPGVFGFLVWELKENWRLYAANRPRYLPVEAIGRHGETMLRLLRPGLHSGTLPRAFSLLRQSLRKSGRWAENRTHRRQLKLHRVEEDIRRFVERELLYLLEQARFFPQPEILIGSVELATNRIEAQLLHCDQPHLPATLTWEFLGGELTGIVSELGWMNNLPEHRQNVLTTAVAGLFQRAGVRKVESRLANSRESWITWEEWIAAWGEDRRPRVGRRSSAKVVPAPPPAV